MEEETKTYLKLRRGRKNASAAPIRECLRAPLGNQKPRHGQGDILGHFRLYLTRTGPQVSPDMMRTDDFDYHLPDELIADRPPERRDGARMLLVDRQAGTVEHRQFTDFPSLIGPEDLVVLNNVRVARARCEGLQDKWITAI